MTLTEYLEHRRIVLVQESKVSTKTASELAQILGAITELRKLFGAMQSAIIQPESVSSVECSIVTVDDDKEVV